MAYNGILIKVSHKPIFKIYILYEEISSLFAISRLCFECMPQNDNFTVHRIISSLNVTDLFPGFANSVINR
jgi:hypothetical protein